MLMRAILDPDALRAFAAAAVTRHAGMEPGRPVGGTYYLYRTLRALDLDSLLDRLMEQLAAERGGFADELEERLAREELAARIERVREEVEAEIRRRLVADRGPAAMARSLRAKLFEGNADLGDAVKRINTEADVVWVDGHSDYGHAFEVFHEKWGREVTPKTSVIILGDARNNYHASQSWVLAELRKKARHLYWIDPEPAAYWNTGDSVIGDYAAHCDGVYECRNLRQLERFVEAVIES